MVIYLLQKSFATASLELNNYEKFKNRLSLDYIRQEYNLNLNNVPMPNEPSITFFYKI